MVAEGDTVRHKSGKEMEVEAVDQHNQKIIFRNAPPIHKAALASGNFEVA